MKVIKLVTAVLLAGSMSIASADLTPWEDYDISEGVSNVTTVKVDSNRIDTYLEGLSKTWAPANEVAIKLGLASLRAQATRSAMPARALRMKAPNLEAARAAYAARTPQVDNIFAEAV